ncbi:30S ribosomal protein [Grosmannia clavigera kw1407]|uniref:Small ribosomal subunit protein uS7m n=1 Tax=Grosmannia clavigera (strain kw1407 / UAMH 11150) TaxID=655863 RepID=F0XBX7_GROCL|nr:30S ribosomal protein [Grosmannia clavigera kw1407]EFX04192.1 30S ribosomal protein [Grosmannia clavigera kw1407]
MRPQRLAALCRSTSRLAIRPQRLTAWSMPATLAAATAAAAASQPRLLGRVPRTALLSRGFSSSFAVRTEAEKGTAGAGADVDGETAVLQSFSGEAQPEPSRQTWQVGGQSVEPGTPENEEALRQLELLSKGVAPFDADLDGHKFGLTTAETRPTAMGSGEADSDIITGQQLPLGGELQDRYDPVISQLTRLLMRDGKLAKAQRDMAMILNFLRTSAAPKLSPAHPLLPGHPPAAQLPLDPVRYLTLAIDSVAPLVKIRSYSGMAGGGASLPVPVPLAARQRRRTAFMWLLDIVNKKPSRGSGRGMLAQRVGEEVIAIAEGRSGLWEKRQLMHKQGTSARVNVSKVKL